MNNVSKVKIAVGYTLLLAVLFFSLFFVHREMENLILTDDRDVQWTDSVLALIREKDTNTIKMLFSLLINPTFALIVIRATNASKNFTAGVIKRSYLV